MIRKLTALFGLAGIAMLAACAQSPDSIAPVSMPGSMYASLSCSQAMNQRNQIGAELAALESKQRSAVAGDAVGVFLLGIPLSSLAGGDKEGLIATAKGKVNALDARLMSC